MTNSPPSQPIVFSPSKSYLSSVFQTFLWMSVFLLILEATGGALIINNLLERGVFAIRQRNISSDVVIVTIDDKSIEALGRWPWDRSIHTQFVELLAKSNPLFVGFDVLFTEDSKPEEDRALGLALKKLSGYALPVFYTADHRGGERHRVDPSPQLSIPVQNLVHIEINLDEHAIARSINPSHPDGILSLSYMASLAGGIGRSGNEFSTVRVPSLAPDDIPFAGHAAKIQRVSYIDVLMNRVDPAVFSRKLILVGSNAEGLGDQFVTPMGRLTPGVEIHATALDAYLNRIVYQRLDEKASYLLAAILFVFSHTLAYLSRGRRLASWLTGLSITTLIVVLTVAAAGDAWIGPSQGLIVILMFYPLWGWQVMGEAEKLSRSHLDRLSHLIADLDDGISIAHQKHTINTKSEIVSVLERLASLSLKLERSEALFRTSLRQYPNPLWVLSEQGTVEQQSQEAYRLFGLRRGQNIEQLFPEWKDWQTLNGMKRRVSGLGGTSTDNLVFDAIRQTIQVAKSAPEYRELLILYDMTKGLEEQRQKEETVRFLSHDFRAPQASIVALSDSLLSRSTPHTADSIKSDLLKIKSLAMRGISLAEEFLVAQRLEQSPQQKTEISISNLIYELMYEFEPRVQEVGKFFEFRESNSLFYTYGDYQLLKRCLGNLIDNAIKYSVGGERILISVELAASEEVELSRTVLITVEDEGPGVPESERELIFESFQQLRSQSSMSSFGLGLSFVRQVVSKSGGSIRCSSSDLGGAKFEISLPSSHIETL